MLDRSSFVMRCVRVPVLLLLSLTLISTVLAQRQGVFTTAIYVQSGAWTGAEGYRPLLAT